MLGCGSRHKACYRQGLESTRRNSRDGSEALIQARPHTFRLRPVRLRGFFLPPPDWVQVAPPYFHCRARMRCRQMAFL